MRIFFTSFIVAFLALAISFWWKGVEGAFICVLMILMDVSFSFDNAVVNATVLRGMNKQWQKRFLTWGMLIAVFGMYYLAPILIVSVATGLSLYDVAFMAVKDPQSYSAHLSESHAQIAAFGGMFLLMVFLDFILNEKKKRHWLGKFEEKLSKLGNIEAIEIILALSLLLVLQSFVFDDHRLHVMVAGVLGIVLYVAMQSFMALLGVSESNVAGYSGFAGFIYLNLLDASFSLDAVVGSFAISNDIIIIVLGLSAGAMFVRSLTVYLVRQGTLDNYVYLEHGAHYAIGALAALMITSIITPVPEVVTGLIGIVFILLSLWSSVSYNRKYLGKTAK